MTKAQDILEIYYPLKCKVHSYSCPDYGAIGPGGMPGKPPSAELTWVIDVGNAIESLPSVHRAVFGCLYGGNLSYRATAKKLSMSLGAVQRAEQRGMRIFARILRRKGVNLPMKLWLRYG